MVRVLEQLDLDDLRALDNFYMYGKESVQSNTYFTVVKRLKGVSLN